MAHSVGAIQSTSAVNDCHKQVDAVRRGRGKRSQITRTGGLLFLVFTYKTSLMKKVVVSSNGNLQNEETSFTPMECTLHALWGQWLRVEF